MYHSSGDVNTGGYYICAGTEDIWQMSLPSPQLCWEPKTAPKE